MIESFEPIIEQQPHLAEENLAGEGVAVGVETVRRQAKNYIACADETAVDHDASIYHATDAAGEILFASLIHAGHLRGFPADQRTAARATRFREAGENLV